MVTDTDEAARGVQLERRRLRALLERLVRMLDSSGVPFMIAGSFASTAHGLPRTTQAVRWLRTPATRP